MSANPTSARLANTSYTPANPGTNAADESPATVVDLNYITQGNTDFVMVDLGATKNIRAIDLYNFYTVPATPYAYIDMYVTNNPASPTATYAGRIIDSGSLPGAASANAFRLSSTQNGYRYVTLVPTFLANAPAGSGSPRPCIVYLGEMLIETDATPTAPASVSAVGVSGGIAVSWPASSSATSTPGLFYRVKRTPAGGAGPTTLVADNITGTSWTDTTAAVGTAYSYTVSAVNPNG